MSAFDRISARVPSETKTYVSKTLDIAERIQFLLERKGMSQKDLALKLEKQPSEISRWLTGLHNFNLKTLVKIEEALGEELFYVVIENGSIVKRGVGEIPSDNLIADKIQLLSEGERQQAIDFIEFLGQKKASSKKYKAIEKQEAVFVNEPKSKYDQSGPNSGEMD